MVSVYLHAPHLSVFGKTNLSIRELSVKTAKNSLSQFSEKIDLVVFSSFAPELFTGEVHLPSKICSDLNLMDIFNFRVETASSSGASALHVAHEILLSGRYKNALVIGTEVMSRSDRNQTNVILGKVLSNMERSFSMSMMQGAALICNRYLHEYGYKKEDLFCIAEKLHENGLSNPIAQIKKRITKDTYLSAPLFSTPLGLYDISPISDGSASLILSTQVHSPLKIIGIGSGTSRFHSPSYEPSFTSSISAFHKAYKMASIGPEKVQIAELHDAFTIFEAIGAEDGGFFPKGKALRNIMEGNTHPEGSFPINVSGGLKTRGHPIAASGLAQICEIFQIMKRKNLKYGITHSIGGLATNNFVTIVENS